jgi:hypothetical protein
MILWLDFTRGNIQDSLLVLVGPHKSIGFGKDGMNSRSGIGKKALISNTANNDFSFNKTKINVNERNMLLSQNVKYIPNRPLLTFNVNKKGN